MKHRHGNGSGKFEIGQHDMGGWVRIVAGRTGDLPDDLPVYLSHALTNWFRQRPQLRMRCVLPINKDGDTVELHAWYDLQIFPDLAAQQGPAQQGEE